MLKFFEKNKLVFSLILILVYVVSFSLSDAFSEQQGIPKLFTVIVGALLSTAVMLFVLKNRLSAYVGLAKIRGSGRNYLFFIPLILLSVVNVVSLMISGETLKIDLHTLLAAVSMIFVGVLEEIIFRGFLFRSLCEQKISTAFVISSLTFGMGHIVNLLSGAPLFDTLMQVIYASAVGFCFTALFYCCDSIIPCIVSHIVVNASGVFIDSYSRTELIVVTIVQTVIGLFYGLWLLLAHKNSDSEVMKNV